MNPYRAVPGSRDLRHFFLPATTLLAALLTGCGGGGGDSSGSGGGNGSGPGGGGNTPPPTYSVTVAVSGVEGSGLKLKLNNGSAINIPGNGSFTFNGLPNQSAYAIAVDAQPLDPGQICVVTNPTGTISGASVSNVSVACATAARTTLKTVASADATVPAAATRNLAKIISLAGSAPPDTALDIPWGTQTRQPMVLGVDGNGEILLAGFAVGRTTSLGVESTALALTRTLMGPVNPAMSQSDLNQAILNTGPFAALKAAILDALSQGQPPANAEAVRGAMRAVIAALPLQVRESSTQSIARRGTQKIADQRIPRTSGSFRLLGPFSNDFLAITTSGASQGGVLIANGMPIQWGVRSVSSNGTSICPGAVGCPTALDEANVFWTAATPFSDVLKNLHSVRIPGQGSAFTIVLEQTMETVSHNSRALMRDGIKTALGELLPGDTCGDSVASALLSPAYAADFLTDPTPDSFKRYLASLTAQKIGEVLSTAVTSCDFSLATTAEVLASKFSFWGKFTLVVDVVDIGTRLALFYKYLDADATSYGVCLGSVAGFSTIENCAHALSFQNTPIYLAPGARTTGPTVKAVDESNVTTPVPGDLVFSSDDPGVISVAADTGEIVARNFSASELAAASRNTLIHATYEPTGVEASYEAHVVQPQLSQTAVETTAGGVVMLSLQDSAGHDIVVPEGVTWDFDNHAAGYIAQSVTFFGGRRANFRLNSNAAAGDFVIRALDPSGTEYGRANIAVLGAIANLQLLTPQGTAPQVAIDGTVATSVRVFDSASHPLPTPKRLTWSTSSTAIATVSTTGVIKGVAPGGASIQVTDLDSGYSASVAVTVLSPGYPSATSFTASANPSAQGVGVYFTIRVDDISNIGRTPRGTAGIFDDAGAAVCSVPLNGTSNSATCLVTFNTIGLLNLRARYSGDAYFAASESAVTTQTVNQRLFVYKIAAGGPYPLGYASAGAVSTPVEISIAQTIAPASSSSAERVTPIFKNRPGVGYNPIAELQLDSPRICKLGDRWIPKNSQWLARFSTPYPSCAGSYDDDYSGTVKLTEAGDLSVTYRHEIHSSMRCDSGYAQSSDTLIDQQHNVSLIDGSGSFVYAQDVTSRVPNGVIQYHFVIDGPNTWPAEATTPPKLQGVYMVVDGTYKPGDPMPADCSN